MSATQTPKENPVCTHLHKRSNGVYYFRRRVPIDLVEFFGKDEFNESLGTKDRRAAVAACRKRSVLTDALFDKARGQMLEEAVTPGPAPAKPMTPEQERAQWEGEQWAIEQAAHDALFEEEIREDKAQRRAGYKSLIAFADSLGLGLPAADKEALQAIFARQTGEASKPADKPAGKASGLDLDDLMDKWAGEKKPAAKTIQRARRVVTEFSKTAGVSRAGQVERSQVLGYKDTMLAAGQSPANINNKLIMLSTVFNHAVKNDLGMASNPATGIKATDKRRAREKRLPFDLTALQAIFSSPVYSAHARPLGGGGEAAYWLPLIALFSGARIEEIAQRHPDDVYEESYHDAAGKAHSAWVLEAVKWDMGGFLYGHFYSAAVGAYECYMHAVVDALIVNEHFSKSALKRLANQLHDAPGAISLRLKKRPIRTSEEARSRLRQATLIDAEKIANIVKLLFDLDLPVPADSKKIARLRNLFSHNGGVRADGTIERIDKDGVLKLVQYLDQLVADTTAPISAHIDSLSGIPPATL